jgi:hypothetical protein
VTADGLLSKIGEKLPEGSILTAGIVIVSYIVPGAEGDDAGPFLHMFRDEDSGLWVHLGMVEAIGAGLKNGHIESTEDDDSGG